VTGDSEQFGQRQKYTIIDGCRPDLESEINLNQTVRRPFLVTEMWLWEVELLVKQFDGWIISKAPTTSEIARILGGPSSVYRVYFDPGNERERLK
jgi:hypothetical protein